jgi:hypothetical protein
MTHAALHLLCKLLNGSIEEAQLCREGCAVQIVGLCKLGGMVVVHVVQCNGLYSALVLCSRASFAGELCTARTAGAAAVFEPMHPLPSVPHYRTAAVLFYVATTSSTSSGSYSGVAKTFATRSAARSHVPLTAKVLQHVLLQEVTCHLLLTSEVSYFGGQEMGRGHPTL